MIKGRTTGTLKPRVARLRTGILVIAIVVSMAIAVSTPVDSTMDLLPAVAHAQQGPGRIAIRTVEGAAEFYNTVTGQRFVLRGANYIDFKPIGGGRVEDRVFDTAQYDPERVREAFTTLAERGYTVVRIFHDLCNTGDTCINHPDGTGLNPAYLDNMVDLMRIAAEKGIYLLLTSNDLPEEGGYYAISDQGISDLIGGYRNANYLTPQGINATRQYWDDLLGGLAERNAPFEVVLGWQLLNEQFYLADIPPFTLSSGLVETSTGTYDMGDPAQKEQMALDNLSHYISEVGAVIRSYDAQALVTIGFFAPNTPHNWRGDDIRYVVTAPLLETATVDFFDLHAYPGSDVSLREYADNFGIQEYTAKPVLLGEFGAFRHLFPAADVAARQVQAWVAESCEYGFDGWLYWEYYGQRIPGDYMWGMLAEDDLILDALAPVNQPDPCVTTEIDVANVALERPATVSAMLPDESAANAVDGTAQGWGAGADAPQWIEIDLEQERSLDEVRLTVGQWPAGETVHRVWARLADDTMVLAREFAQYTADDMTLRLALAYPLQNVVALRVETLSSPSWVAWKEIEVYEGDPHQIGQCYVEPEGNGVNLRASASTGAALIQSLAAGEAVLVDDYVTGAEGLRWWHTTNDTWVREDVVTGSSGCGELLEGRRVRGVFEWADAAVEAPPGLIPVTFRVAVPEGAQGVYLAGSFPGTLLPEWDPSGIPLVQADEYWTVTLDLLTGERVEYKYTAGSWDEVEKDANCVELANRTLTVLPADSLDVADTVANWRSTDCDG